MQRERLTYLFHEGDKVDYIYIVQSGEFKVTKRELVAGESLKEAATEEIFKAPLTADRHNCEFMTKNKKKVYKTVTLEHLGEKTVIGLQDLINDSPTYSMTMVCISQSARLYRIHVNDFLLLKKSQSGAKDT